jgi:hypothetical protein
VFVFCQNCNGIENQEQILKLKWDTLTSWSLFGLGVEVSLTPNFMKGIRIFPLSIVGSLFFFFLPSKLDMQCMVIVKKELFFFFFQNPFKLMFNKYTKQCKVGERHLNSYFYKKSKFYKVCNDSKNNVCFNVVVGFGNWNTKIQLTFIGIWIAHYWFY